MTKWVAIAFIALAFAGGAQAQQVDQESLRIQLMSYSTVKDVAFTSSGNVYVGVLDNGNNRDGYAMSVCEDVREFATGSGRVLVKMIDIAVAARGDGFEQLGKYWCEI
ncbi:hypothetical protein R3F64_01210 [Halomonas sp. 5021]|jgi:hypothetical protein|uniref:hypothetical protein n=1 Tax=Halomonas sp. 5021 TaxID=3082156 RepID=UPI002FCA531D